MQGSHSMVVTFHWVRVRVRSRGWGDSAQWPGVSDTQDRCWQVRTHSHDDKEPKVIWSSMGNLCGACVGDPVLSYVVPIQRRETFLFLPRHISCTVFVDSSYWAK